MKAPPTGRREPLAHLSMPRRTNTYMLAGDKDPERTYDRWHRLTAANYGFGQLQTSEPLSKTTRQTPGASRRQVELNLAKTFPSGFDTGPVE